MKSPFTMRRALSRRLTKPEHIFDSVDLVDFKVLTAQKLVSCKLDDHLKISNPETPIKSKEEV